MLTITIYGRVAERSASPAAREIAQFATENPMILHQINLWTVKPSLSQSVMFLQVKKTISSTGVTPHFPLVWEPGLILHAAVAWTGGEHPATLTAADLWLRHGTYCDIKPQPQWEDTIPNGRTSAIQAAIAVQWYHTSLDGPHWFTCSLSLNGRT
jgi:hypothetical protein